MFADLDDFKLVNDRLGHAAGDRLLAEVADRLRGKLRATDVLGRHGGDEFLVLLADVPGDPIAKAETVASNLLGALREPFVIGTSEVKIGGSVGISVYPEDATDTEALLRHADVAMYAAQSPTAAAGTRSTSTPTRCARGAPAFRRSCAARSTRTSSSCTTSRSGISPWTAAGSRGWRR